MILNKANSYERWLGRSKMNFKLDEEMCLQIESQENKNQ